MWGSIRARTSAGSRIQPRSRSSSLRQGEIDAFLGFPPQPQDLRARKIGHVLVDSNVDKPWSSYFCCMLAGNRDFVRAHPIATKRALRAILRRRTSARRSPDRAARLMVDTGRTRNYDLMRQTLDEVRYDRWRETNR